MSDTPITSPPNSIGSFFGGSDRSQMDMFSRVSTLWSAINLRMNAVSKTTFRLYRGNIGDGAKTEVTKHPALVVLQQPNPDTSRTEFFRTWQAHRDLTGKAYIYVAKSSTPGFSNRPLYIYNLRPDLTDPVTDELGETTGYRYTPPSGGGQVIYDAADIDFMRYIDPANPISGIGPVKSLFTELHSSALASDWQRFFFLNSANPGGVLEYDQVLEDHEMERIVKQLEELHKGVRNSHRVLIANGGRWQSNAQNVRDMQFPELREGLRDAVLETFGVPKILLGQTNNVNRASAETAEYIFAKWVIEPILVDLREWLNYCFLPRFSSTDRFGRLYFDFDSPVKNPDEEEGTSDE